MSCRSSPVVVMATWSAFSGGIWDRGRRVVAARCRQRWRAFRRFCTFLLRLDAIGYPPLQGLHSSLTCLACPRHRLARVCHDLPGHPRTCQSPSSCRDDPRGGSVKAHPSLLADTRRRIVYGRGIPYGERHHVSKAVVSASNTVPRLGMHRLCLGYVSVFLCHR